MLEILYRIYEVADEKTAEENLNKDKEFGLFSSISKAQNNELLMDCCICDTREQFKEIIRCQYGNAIAFRYSKKLKAGDLYCIIIGEHCYKTERYFKKVNFKCDCCGTNIETYYGEPICFSDWDIREHLYGIEEYLEKRFCSNNCKQVYKDKMKKSLKPDGETEFFVSRDMFIQNVAGYIYKITKKSTGEFYIGQTQYAPMFRWAQHLKSDRFTINDIKDYTFETLCIVQKGENILDVEKQYIKEYFNKYPKLSLNISCVTQDMKNKGETLIKEIKSEELWLK